MLLYLFYHLFTTPLLSDTKCFYAALSLQPDQKLTWVQKKCKCTVPSLYKAGVSFSLHHPYFWQCTAYYLLKKLKISKQVGIG